MAGAPGETGPNRSDGSPDGTEAGASKLRVIGPGRAGGSMMTALGARGWSIETPLGRADDVAAAAQGVDVVLIATPDGAIAEVSQAIEPGPAVVGHLSGALGLDVLSDHERRLGLHPLVSLPDAVSGAKKLSGAWFGIAGDPLAAEIVRQLGGRPIELRDEDRAGYHAAAAVAANHLVAIFGQVERIAESIGVPLEAYLDLAQGSLDSVRALGPAAALTGPAARGDEETLKRHRQAIDPSELEAYDALVRAAQRLRPDDPA